MQIFFLEVLFGEGMTFNERLNQVCAKRNSLVCVGLDVDLNKIPRFILDQKEPQVFFSKAIIDATIEYFKANGGNCDVEVLVNIGLLPL